MKCAHFATKEELLNPKSRCPWPQHRQGRQASIGDGQIGGMIDDIRPVGEFIAGMTRSRPWPEINLLPT